LTTTSNRRRNIFIAVHCSIVVRELNVKELRASNEYVLITSNDDIDCIKVHKNDIGELINELEEYNE